MPARMSVRRRIALTVAAALIPVVALTTAPAALAAPAPDPVVASGPDWAVTTTPGGYLVTLTLDEPLPIVDDAPTLIVDGEPLGLATEATDGLSLGIITTDPAVAHASSVTKGWSSGEEDKAAETPEAAQTPAVPENTTLTKQMKSLAAAAAVEDPSDLGSYSVTEAEYDFGDQAVPLAAIGGIRGELTGKMYLSSATGARPTIVLLHGRHTSCSGSGANPLRWPCGPTQMNIRSYLGYEGTARALASHGYNVLSIAANSVNSNDNQLALDYGAQARGQLILDTLGMLAKANAGETVAYDDITTATDTVPSTTTTRTLDEALVRATTRTDQPAASSGVTASALKGRFDLGHVGIMGHSRGGEGVVSAATLNQALAKPYGIESVLPLAPVDFGRMTLPDVPTAVFLPYCDGDVSNQQGQHFIDDSRHAFDDNVLRSAVWVMGANHNFFNTVWTPGLYPAATGDDWRTSDTTSTCATSDPTRMTAAQQYQVGVSYMTGFFRLTMGGETQFQSLFDGSVKPSTTATSYADVRTMASQPASKTALVNDFTETSSLVRVSGGATAAVCTNLTGRTVPQSLPFCATTKASAQVPHWTPGSFAPNVPEFPVTRFLWTGASTTDPAVPSTGELRVTVPAKYRDVSRQAQLTLKTAPDEAVQNGTDFTITVVDGAGKTFAVAASAVNPLAINRMPGGTNTTLNKVVLQQLTIPTSTITGIDLTDVREVRFAAKVGADGTGTGGVYLSDLAFDTPSVGTAVVQTRTSVNVAPTIVEEGNGPGTADVAVYLNRAEKATVTAYVSVLGSATGVVGVGMEKVSFAPGETCKSVTVPTLGNTATSTAASSAFKVSATNSTNAVMGARAFANLTVREDDGVTGTAIALAPVGAQGDVCAELAAATTPVPLGTSAEEVAPGGSFTLSATGYRAGETVTFRYGGSVLGTQVAAADGTASMVVPVAEDADLGPADATATGSGSARTATVTVSVLAPTETALTVLPEKPTAGEKTTFTATVTGRDTAGTVAFLDGGEPVAPATAGTALSAAAADAPTVLGEVEIVDGVATLTLPAGLTAGEHVITASFARTATASASTSDPITVTVAPAASTGGSGSGSGSGTDAAASGSDALAETGSAIGLWLLAGLTVLLAGGGLVLVSRRRRTAE
ncbi:Ig-like domain repeat protein [Leifsonia sp. ZF2019]|uniref:Ig-like domain-containing protein n=1 Tax=Leifsonia sp. ZF2019 TaxID=2781978 RepID=UPI001CBFFDE8|nr:Ig-like domain-containing protein [Leifsonia sp. ZF2019]UAJ79886.1 Ig-like domain repeat protein [Leifsonia sp. ZF2019]